MCSSDLCTNILHVFLAEYLCDGTSMVAYDLIHCNVQSIIVVVRLLLCRKSEVFVTATITLTSTTYGMRMIAQQI